MKSKIILLIISFFSVQIVFSQVGINTTTPDSSAVLHLESNDRGFLPPVLDNIEMNGIANPADGLMLYNEEDSLVEYWNGECWLKAYQKSCNECEFSMSIADDEGIIDRTTNDSIQTTISIIQTNGNSQISLFTIGSLPAGINISLDSTIVNGTGDITLTAFADIFAPAGTYPIVVQSVCDQVSYFVTYNLIVEPCIQVDITTDMFNVDLQSDFSLPGVGNPVCILLDVHNGVNISSANTSDYAMTWGALDPNSHVGFLNNGGIYARGGDGTGPGNILTGSVVTDGEDGGNALELTCRTTFNLNGAIYSGGGGGGGGGGELSTGNLPVIGAIGAAAGAGGGGGAADGQPGTASAPPNSPLFFSFVEDGNFGTGGINGQGGDGGNQYQDIPFDIDLTVATLSITPFVDIQGGNGGDYGENGGNGIGNAGLEIGIAIPIFGNIFSQSFPFTLATAQGGQAGDAIDANGNQINNLIVPNNNIKGDVNP